METQVCLDWIPFQADYWSICFKSALLADFYGKLISAQIAEIKIMKRWWIIVITDLVVS